MTPRWKWMLLLLVVVVLFYWKIVFTGQFSVLLGYEGANHVYSWYHFSASTIQQGVLPLWDPYAHSGRSFVGEMHSGLFYPLKLPLYLWPLNQSGLLSARTFHHFYVFAHILAALFMFLLAQELRLSNFAAFVAALCFSLGGFLGRVGWPHMLDTAIWLPLVLLFLIRAIGSQKVGRCMLYACLAGLGLGMATLAGSLHLVMMDVLVVVSAGAYFAYHKAGHSGGPAAGRLPWIRCAAVLAIAGTIAFAFGAIQLLPSLEYSKLAIRFFGAEHPLPARQIIPYGDLSYGLLPRSAVAFLLAFPFGGAIGDPEHFSPYLGVFPLLLVAIGIGRNWDKPWVKYLTALAGLAFFYTLGGFSFLHGLLYVLVPFLWMAREPVRFLYLAHFAMAILAGIGVQTLFGEQAQAHGLFTSLARVLKWVLIVGAVALGIPALYGKPEINEWTYFSFLVIIASSGLFFYIIRGHATPATRFLLVALILCDLHAFNWTVQNKIRLGRSGKDEFARLLSCRNLANFLNSQSGLFRVHMKVDWQPDIGDLFGVQTTWGMAATTLKDYEPFLRTVPRAKDLLNVRYVIRDKPVGEAAPVYNDGAWLAYENPSYCPRAWVVHQVTVEASTQRARQRISQDEFDPLREAVVSVPLAEPLEPLPEEGAKERVRFARYQADRLELAVSARSRGLLVLSEVHYPGWQATVNGRPAQIHKVNGLLRGVVVPGGDSRVVLRYAPRSVLAGAVLSLSALLGTLMLAAILWMREKRARKTAAVRGE